MPVADELMPLLEALRAVEGPPDALTPEMLRASFDPLWASWASGAAGLDVSDHTIAGPGGDLALRVYRPTGSSASSGASDVLRPLVLALHGGGFVIGSIESNDATARELAQRADAVVASLDYRLAPEHPYPAAIQDTCTAISWLADHGAELGGDADRLVVLGDSAGGNLAATAALRTRDEGGPPIALQVCIYPCFDPSCSSASMQDNGEGYLLRRDLMAWFWGHYLADPAAATDPYVDPRRADDLSGLPPAVVVTAEFDPLRDEGDEYAELLVTAGVDVTHVREAGMIHGYASMFSLTERAGQIFDRIGAIIRAC